MYVKEEVFLTKNQVENLAKAMKNNDPINLRVSANALKRKNKLATLYLTKVQKNRLSKARRSNSGAMLKLSKAQLSHMKKQMKQGGFLGALSAAAPIVLGSLGSQLLGDVLGMNKGDGLFTPGSGLFMPGTFRGKGQGVPLNEFLGELGCCCKNNKVYVKKK